jgi:hypothetical protein
MEQTYQGLYTEIKTNPVEIILTGYYLMVLSINTLNLIYR